jgi:hypothetical protein
VKDYRQVVRVANLQNCRVIDAAGHEREAVPGAAGRRGGAVRRRDGQPGVLHEPEHLLSALNKQLFEKSANLLEYIERGGKRVPHFLGIPIRISDALTNARDLRFRKAP